jgi:hypothetical protein
MLDPAQTWTVRGADAHLLEGVNHHGLPPAVVRETLNRAADRL